MLPMVLPVMTEMHVLLWIYAREEPVREPTWIVMMEISAPLALVIHKPVLV